MVFYMFTLAGISQGPSSTPSWTVPSVPSHRLALSTFASGDPVVWSHVPLAHGDDVCVLFFFFFQVVEAAAQK